MNTYRLKAIVHDANEYRIIYNGTRGRDGLPVTCPVEFPAIILEIEHEEDSVCPADKRYIFLEAADVRELAGPSPEHLNKLGASRTLRARKPVLGWVEQGRWKDHRRFLIPEGTLVGQPVDDADGVKRVILLNGCEVLHVAVHGYEGFDEVE